MLSINNKVYFESVHENGFSNYATQIKFTIIKQKKKHDLLIRLVIYKILE